MCGIVGAPYRSGEAPARRLPIGRWAALALLLVAELGWLRFDSTGMEMADHWWVWILRQPNKHRLLLSIVGAVAFFSWRSLVEESRREQLEGREHWQPWLGAHLMTVAAFAFLRWLGLTHGLIRSPHATLWLALWVACGMLLLATWLAALLSPRSWRAWLERSRAAVAAGVFSGTAAFAGGHYAENLWRPLQASTLAAVSALLRLSGHEPVVDMVSSRIGTSRFAVRVGELCTGLEGLGVIAVFLGIYFWIYRRELRFPQVLLLAPIAFAAMFFLNALRIAALILIGGWRPDIAVGGFHSVAAWIYVNAVAFAVVIASRRMRLFARLRSPATFSPAAGEAAFYLIPFAVTIATAMVTQIFVGDFDALYPLRVATAGVALLVFHRQLRGLPWEWSSAAAGIGVVTFVLWVVFEQRPVPATDAAIGASLAELPLSAAAAWIALRGAGSVLVAPLVEELAFRGYLIRKLVASEFETVDFRRFTWVSFLGSSLLFGAIHGRWIAGTLAGMLFAAALYRRGRLGDAVLAHGVANALVTVRVVATGHWSLWS